MRHGPNLACGPGFADRCSLTYACTRLCLLCGIYAHWVFFLTRSHVVCQDERKKEAYHVDNGIRQIVIFILFLCVFHYSYFHL